MASLNKTMIIGNLGRDPEMRFTPSGKPVTSFSVAVSNRYQKDGEWQEETTWFNVSAWGKLAEACNQNLSKGQSVYIEGSVKLHEWEGKDGAKRASLKLTASTVKFLTKREKMDATTGTTNEVEPGDIPF